MNKQEQTKILKLLLSRQVIDLKLYYKLSKKISHITNKKSIIIDLQKIKTKNIIANAF